MVKILYFLSLYLHITACIWWSVVKEKKTWISPLFSSDEDLWYFTYNTKVSSQYYICLHTAIILFTGNDITPEDRTQLLVTIGGMFLGAIISANIFGELAVLITMS